MTISDKVIKNYLESELKTKIEVLEFSFIGEGYYANGYKVVYKIGGGKVKTNFIRIMNYSAPSSRGGGGVSLRASSFGRGIPGGRAAGVLYVPK